MAIRGFFRHAAARVHAPKRRRQGDGAGPVATYHSFIQINLGAPR